MAINMLKNKKIHNQSVTVKKRSNFTPANLFLKTLIEGNFTSRVIDDWNCLNDDIVNTIRYDSGYLTCSKKLTGIASLVYHTEQTKN